MLGHSPFYWSHFKKYIVVMGTLLNDITIVRETNGKTKVVKVPVSFGQKDKQLNRLITNPELKNSWKNYLPRIAFEMGSPTYNAERKDNTQTLYTITSDGNRRKFQQPAAPYDIPFTVTIWTAYYEDSLQIIEQIMPFFQPEYVMKVNEVPALDIKRDVSISLVGITQNDTLDGEFTEGRIIEWQLEFNLKGWFYGALEEKAIIKRAAANIFIAPSGDEDGDEFLTPVIEYEAVVDPFNATKDEPHQIIENKVIN